MRLSFVIKGLLLFCFAFASCSQSGQHDQQRGATTTDAAWRHHQLIYTKHARCRMQCRDISAEEVQAVLASGAINLNKSKEGDEESENHCPTYALEGNTNDGQHVRIVFAACDNITKVVTAIDLGVEHPCDCK